MITLDDIFPGWQPSEVTAFTSVLTALAALIVSPVVSYLVALRQSKITKTLTEQQIGTSLKIAEAQINASSLSVKRQEWINTLRGELTTILALVGEIDGSKSDFRNIHSRFVTASSKTELLINPLEPDHQALVNALSDYYRAITASEVLLDWKASEGEYRQLLTLWGQLVLKKEWMVIRDGKPNEEKLSEIRTKIAAVTSKIDELRSAFKKSRTLK